MGHTSPGNADSHSFEEANKTLLQNRAKELSREPPAATVSSDYLEVVEFVLAHERYAIESASVREVYPLKDLTPLPCTPPFVLGLVNVRGQILTVLDIKRFFDLPEKGLTDLNKVIIVRVGRMELGVLADEILGVRLISLKELQPSLPTLTGLHAEYLRGVTSERTVVLDIAHIMADEKLTIHEEVAS